MVSFSSYFSWVLFSHKRFWIRIQIRKEISLGFRFKYPTKDIPFSSWHFNLDIIMLNLGICYRSKGMQKIYERSMSKGFKMAQDIYDEAHAGVPGDDGV